MRWHLSIFIYLTTVSVSACHNPRSREKRQVTKVDKTRTTGEISGVDGEKGSLERRRREYFETTWDKMFGEEDREFVQNTRPNRRQASLTLKVVLASKLAGWAFLAEHIGIT